MLHKGSTSELTLEPNFYDANAFSLSKEALKYQKRKQTGLRISQIKDEGL